jgi:hypothetical protein
MMAKYFVKKKYEKSIISRETFEEWQKLNPQFADKTYVDFTNYWYHLRNEFFNCVIENPSGVDLPLFMGNMSVKILDIDFKGKEDYLKTNLTDKETGEKIKVPFVGSDVPKGVKIVWKKHKLFQSLPSIFGCEIAKTMKITVSKGVRNNLNNYEKAFNHDKIKSKHKPVEEKSLFDLA